MPNSAITPKKSLGQHWLNDEAALSDIVEAADIGPNDTVLEIGPGPGGLTGLLVGCAEKVVAIELDDELAAELPRRVLATNLAVIHLDVLSYDFTVLPAGYKVVANIPYYLTSNLLRLLSETSNPPAAAVLLIQKEVAERAAAGPGEMSLLSVTAQFYWQIKLGRIVPAGLFTPPPKVDSQLLIMRRRSVLPLPAVEHRQFFRLAKAGFSQRRKTLLNSLSAGLDISREETEALCERASIDGRRRAQTLSLDEWLCLHKALHN